MVQGAIVGGLLSAGFVFWSMRLVLQLHFFFCLFAQVLNLSLDRGFAAVAKIWGADFK